MKVSLCDVVTGFAGNLSADAIFMNDLVTDEIVLNFK